MAKTQSVNGKQSRGQVDRVVRATLPDAPHSFEHTHDKVTVWMANVENAFIGISLTERDGLNMRRVATELRDVDAAKRLRAFLDAMIERMSP